MNEIYTRVSVRKFEDRPVEPEKITQLLKAAMQAPSAGNQQPWEFFVVTDKEKIKALSQSNPYALLQGGGCEISRILRDRPEHRYGKSVARSGFTRSWCGVDRHCSAERQNGKGRSSPRQPRRASRLCTCSSGLSGGDKGTAKQV